MAHKDVNPGTITGDTPVDDSEQQRRKFLMSASGLAMSAGLLGGYGTFGYMLADFVYPADSNNKDWLFVCTTETLSQGEALDFATPAGAKIVVARHGAGTTADDFLALSSVCPHLGCRVHWESEHDRFFCPCHNGAFDRQGAAVSGPPKAASQSLVKFPLKVENGMLFLETSLETVVASCVGRPERTIVRCHPDSEQSGVA